MTYPREILLDKDTEDRLASYIEEELSNHYGERGRHVEDLMRWQRDYWATPSDAKLTFPFTGAANIVIPLSAIAIEAIHSRNMTTRFGFKQLVSAESLSDTWEDAERPLERFMDTELIDAMRIRTPMGDCYLSAEKYGTMIGKTGYEKLVKTAVREVGDREEEFDVVMRDGAEFSGVSDARFLMPHSAKDPQTSPWCGEEHTASPYEIMMLERGGMFREYTITERPSEVANDGITPIESRVGLHAWITNGDTGMGQEGGKKFDRQQTDLEHTSPIWPRTIDWVELWLAFDIDQSGRDKEIVVHYHRPSKTFMSIRYNWHSDLRRPYRVGVYFPVEFRWRGLGICKQNEQFQKEVTTQHRQRLDNATIVNTRMFKIAKLSGYGPKEPIFPGKMWFVDNKDDVESFQMGEIYPSSYNNEQGTLIYSQQRTGVNEQTLGMPQVGTPGTATSDLARIQEGNKKFDFIYQNFTEFTNDCIMDIVATIHQFGPRRLAFYDVDAGGKRVQEFFELPAGLVKDNIVVKLKAAGQQQNKLLERQNWVQLAPLMQQYYEGLLMLAQPTGNPQLTQMIVQKGMFAASEAMRQILEAYDVRNIDRIVVKEIEDMLNGIAAAGSQPGANNGANRTGQISPVVNSPVGIPPARQIGNGTTNRFLGAV